MACDGGCINILMSHTGLQPALLERNEQHYQSSVLSVLFRFS